MENYINFKLIGFLNCHVGSEFKNQKLFQNFKILFISCSFEI